MSAAELNAAEEWMVLRLDSPPDLRLMRNQYDNWDVMLRIDGGYRLEDAHRAIDVLRTEVVERYAEVLRKLRARGDSDAA